MRGYRKKCSVRTPIVQVQQKRDRTVNSLQVKFYNCATEPWRDVRRSRRSRQPSPNSQTSLLLRATDRKHTASHPSILQLPRLPLPSRTHHPKFYWARHSADAAGHDQQRSPIPSGITRHLNGAFLHPVRAARRHLPYGPSLPLLPNWAIRSV